VQGFTVQRMVELKQAHRFVVGASVDRVFGPVILFGQGGSAVEVLADPALSLPRLNTPLALAQIACTRLAELLRGYRGEPAANIDGIAKVLPSVSQLLVDPPELAELDIKPLLVNHKSAVVLGARVRGSDDRPASAANFAIQPPLQHLAESWIWQGESITLRPIQPQDETQHRRFLEQLGPSDIWLRVCFSRRTVEHSEFARLPRIDYTREMAFIATRHIAGAGGETLGTVPSMVDPNNIAAEFGVIVRCDLKGSGLGHRLMVKLIEYLSERASQRLVGTVLRENTAMLELAQRLGFQETVDPNNPDNRSTRAISLDLQPSARDPDRSGWACRSPYSEGLDRLGPNGKSNPTRPGKSLSRSPTCHPSRSPRAALCCCAAPASSPPPLRRPGSPRRLLRVTRCSPRPVRAKGRFTR